MLRKMGAQIEGDETSTLRIRGVEKLHGTRALRDSRSHRSRDVSRRRCDHRWRPDDHELRAGTSRAPSSPRCSRPECASTRSTKLRCACGPPTKLVGADMTTEEYPGFATDMQAQYMALATQAEGASVITETIFENRYLHASEMVRMGANISVDGRRAVVRGPAQALRHDRTSIRFARQRRARARRARRQRRDHHRPRLPHRPRLRAHRRKAERRRCATSSASTKKTPKLFLPRLHQSISLDVHFCTPPQRCHPSSFCAQASLPCSTVVPAIRQSFCYNRRLGRTCGKRGISAP